MSVMIQILRGCSLPLELLIIAVIFVKYMDCSRRKISVSIGMISLIFAVMILSPVVFAGMADETYIFGRLL